MRAPEGICDLFGWRKTGAPNIADKGSRDSVEIAVGIFGRLDITRGSTEEGQTLGSQFEKAVASFLRHELPPGFEVGSGRIADYRQYRHLARLDRLVRELDETGTLRAEMGTDYLIRPDVTVSLDSGGSPFLHAAVSCKWTIRSDRVQNIRHEGVILTRHRRGRQPHIVTVTAEPLPSRLAAIARGTGEIDCVYQVAFDELALAVADLENEREDAILRELISQDRLRPLSGLPVVLERH